MSRSEAGRTAGGLDPLWRLRSTRARWMVVATILGLGAAIDAVTPNGYVVGLVYMLALAASLWLPGVRATLILGALSVALAAGKLLWEPRLVAPPHVVIVNRQITVAALVLLTVGLAFHKWLIARHLRELRTRAARQRALLDVSPEGIVALDGNGIVRLANLAAQRALGDSLIGGPLTRVLPDWRQPQAGAAGPTLTTFEGTAYDRYAIIEVAAVPVAQDSEIATVCSVRDVRERRAFEERLRQKAKMESIGLFAGGIAHDLNNVFTAQLGFLQFVLEATPANDSRRSDLLEVERLTRRAAELVGRILAFSRRSAQRLQEIDVPRVLLEMKPMIDRLLREDVVLELRLADRLPPALADAAEVTQIAMNLILNARDALPNGGRILVEADAATLDEQYVASHPGVRAGAYVRLTVSDNGVGLDRETRERIFEPFYTTKGGAGSGLGLAVVYGAVQRMGGHIWVYSEPGRGTTFRVYLPQASACVSGAAVHAPQMREQPAVRGATILVCEDEAAVRRMAVQTLRRAGYIVLEATDGIEGLKTAHEHAGDLDLLLTDVVMPRMSGRELAVRLRAARPGCRVLYVSGYTNGAANGNGSLDGDARLLHKPYTPDQLLAEISRVLLEP